MRTFTLVRDKDETGISGTGEVANGVQFADGTVVLRWLGVHPSLLMQSIADAMHVHGHGGLTRVVWDDE